MIEEKLKLRNFKVSVEGSCDGLVLLDLSSDLSDKIILWNPSSRETRVIPNPPVDSGWTKWRHCIGYDSSADDYKLLRISFLPREITSEEEDFTLRILKLRTNSWKTIDPRKGYDGLSYMSILFLNGAIDVVVKTENQVQVK
ncbi:hypothetical protein JCGZ_16250 [Jatropha curcas]|uniref:F-box associated beta-propeller type 1 domain-containing protein n=1 Tax=Jatropha curcas TaxID=180498 RepID=A0A067K381_JATCU|nr:hypothetical protein JCGZ_16250 [Jatropha curcas]